MRNLFQIHRLPWSSGCCWYLGILWMHRVNSNLIIMWISLSSFLTLYMYIINTCTNKSSISSFCLQKVYDFASVTTKHPIAQKVNVYRSHWIEPMCNIWTRNASLPRCFIASAVLSIQWCRDSKCWWYTSSMPFLFFCAGSFGLYLRSDKEPTLYG